MEKNHCISALYNQLFDDVRCGDLDNKYEFMKLTYDILENDEFRELKDIVHHKKTNRLLHSLHVSYYCYCTCKKYGWDYRSAARGALLHDFFRIDNVNVKKRIKYLLGLYHPRMAMLKASSSFDLNKIEKSCILRHMFPLTIIPTKYKEAWTVIWWDKVWGTRELFAKNYMMYPQLATS